MTKLHWAFLIPGAGAALLVGFSKTGMPGAAMPAVALMAEAFREETKLSVGALLPILLLGDIFAVLFYRRHAQWDRLWKLLPYVVVGMVPGYLVLRFANSDFLRLLLGGLILALLTLHILSERFDWGQMPDRWWFVPITGLLAGFGTTVGNAAGPVMSIFLVSNRLDKHEFLGTAAWFYFLVNLSKVPLFVSLNMVTRETLCFDAVIAPVVLVGAAAGILVLKRIPQRVFDVLVLLLAGVASLRMILV